MRTTFTPATGKCSCRSLLLLNLIICSNDKTTTKTSANLYLSRLLRCLFDNVVSRAARHVARHAGASPGRRRGHGLVLTSMENKPNRIIWHHSADATLAPQFDKINAYHKKQWNYKSALGFYGGYHILIENDGTIRRYRNDNEIGAHDAGENVNSLGVCLAGNFSISYPSREQQNVLAQQLRAWCALYNIPINRIDPHRMGDTTECPGKLLNDEFARLLLTNAPPINWNDVLDEVIKYIESKKNASL